MAAKILKLNRAPAQARYDDEELLTLEEAAAWLKLSKRTLYYHVERDSIPYLKAGRLLRFSRQALMDWMQRQARLEQIDRRRLR